MVYLGETFWLVSHKDKSSNTERNVTWVADMID